MIIYKDHIKNIDLVKITEILNISFGTIKERKNEYKLNEIFQRVRML